MPLYEYCCPVCDWHTEVMLPLKEYEKEIFCIFCVDVKMDKVFNKLTTYWKEKDRKWGTSLYRSHDKGEKIGKQKRKGCRGITND